MTAVNISILQGLTLKAVENAVRDGESVIFEVDDGRRFVMEHHQD